MNNSSWVFFPKTSTLEQWTPGGGRGVPHLADHGGEVSSVQQGVLGVSHSGRVFGGFLIGEGPPF